MVTNLVEGIKHVGIAHLDTKSFVKPFIGGVLDRFARLNVV